MKPTLFALLALFFTFQAGAQNKITTPVSLAKQTWKTDSISSSGAPVEDAERIRNEMGSLTVTFLDNGRAWIRAGDEMVLMNYDVSKGSKGSYLNFSGVLMIYFEILELNENTLTLGFQYPKIVNSDLMKFHLSKVSYSLVDSLQYSLDGNYLLGDYLYSSGYDENGNRRRLSSTTHMRLFDDGKMICNFGTLDSGTWVVDAKKMELRLQGQQNPYHFSIESYLAKTIRLKGLSGSWDTTFTLYKSPFANFDEEDDYVVEEEVTDIARMEAEMMAVDTMPIDYETDEYVPEKTQSDMLSISWKAYAFADNGETEIPKSDIYLTFKPDGTFYYTSGGKTRKGSWKLKERSQTMVLTWNKKEEVAQYWWDYFYYDESYDTKTSLNIVFTPPGEKKAVTIEFRPVTTE